MIENSSRRAIHALLVAGIICSVPWFGPHSKFAAASSGASIGFSTLRIGEVLNYRIDWQRYAGAGVAQLQIVDRGNLFGAPAWHFRASVHTAQPVRALYPMDDQIDSYALVDSLEGREYEEHFREFGTPQDISETLIAPGEISDAPAPRVIVPTGTRDVLTTIYFLRAKNWHEQHELRAPVYDGQDVYEMVATAHETSNLHIAIGSYGATEIDIHLLDGKKEIPDEDFRIWLADDVTRTPLLCEAQLPIGKIRVELMSDSANNTRATAPLTPPGHSNHPAGN